jgi:hypothetical protein
LLRLFRVFPRQPVDFREPDDNPDGSLHFRAALLTPIFHPEDHARAQIDASLAAAGWVVQSRAEMNLRDYVAVSPSRHLGER